MKRLTRILFALAVFGTCFAACDDDRTEEPGQLRALSFRSDPDKEYLSIPRGGEYILTCIATPLTADIPALEWRIDSPDGKIDFLRADGAIVQTGRSVKLRILEAEAEATVSVSADDGRIEASVRLRSDGPEQQGVDSIYIRTLTAERALELYPDGMTAAYLSPTTTYGQVEVLPSNVENNGGAATAHCANISVDMEQADEIFFIQVVALSEVAEGLYEEMDIPDDVAVNWFAAQNATSVNAFNVNRYTQAAYADMPRDIARVLVKKAGAMGEGIVSVGSHLTAYRVTTVAAAPAAVAELSFAENVYDVATPPGKFKLACEARLDPAGGECPELVWSCSNDAFTLSRGSNQGNDLLEDWREIWVVPTADAPVGEMGIVTVSTLDGKQSARTIVRLVEGSAEEVPLEGIYLRIYDYTNSFAVGEYWADDTNNVTVADIPNDNTKYLYLQVMPYPANATEQIDFANVEWSFQKGCFNAPTGAGLTGLAQAKEGARVVATGTGSQPITVTYGDWQATVRINVVEQIGQADVPEQIFVRLVPNPAAYWGVLPSEGRIYPAHGVSAFPVEWSADDINDVNSVTMRYAAPTGTTAYERALYFEIETLPGDCSYNFNVNSTWSVDGTAVGSNSANNGNATGVSTRRICRIHPLDPTGKSPEPATVTVTAGELVKTFQITVQ